jgi:hypothetical protein
VEYRAFTGQIRDEFTELFGESPKIAALS